MWLELLVLANERQETGRRQRRHNHTRGGWFSNSLGRDGFSDVLPRNLERRGTAAQSFLVC